MIGTRERNDVNIRQERINEYAPLRNNDYRPDYSFRGYDNYSNYDNNEVRYAQKYENIDFYNRQYDCYANEKVFRPIELADINQDVKTVRQKNRSKLNISTKCKVLIGVYAALVVLIVSMLLINCIPAVSAQTKVEEQSVVSESAEEGYVYDTETNWFDNFCDGVSKMFD